MTTAETSETSGTVPAGADLADHIVFYDGVCGLCAWSVRWLLDHDEHGRLSFAPLQGDTARALDVPWDEGATPSEASMAFVDTTGGAVRILHRSRAVLEAMRVAEIAPVLQRVVRYTPRPVADAAYRFVAAIRYRVFGKHDECRIPSPEQRARFLP
ncbi:MAG: DCC1-like thiol-disulfide oxidoreductase family protein [Acidimicrobiales bacterium]|nr:DCC1-like thiol-disulfide oxidoreductase family protein [Acidimicrobiales bacterium]